MKKCLFFAQIKLLTFVDLRFFVLVFDVIVNAGQDRVWPVLQEEDEDDGEGVRRKRARELHVDRTKASPQSNGSRKGSENN